MSPTRPLAPQFSHGVISHGYFGKQTLPLCWRSAGSLNDAKTICKERNTAISDKARNNAEEKIALSLSYYFRIREVREGLQHWHIVWDILRNRDTRHEIRFKQGLLA